MPVVIAALLGLTGLVIVIYPLLGIESQREDAAPAMLADLGERERAARTALREVEFDYTLGNLESAEYQTLRTRYERRALAALKTRYQREQELDALIERQLEALRASEPEAPSAALQPASRSAKPASRTPTAAQRANAARARRRRGAGN